jgi:hypothetical protein
VSNSTRNVVLAITAVVGLALALGVFVASREPNIDPAKADSARSACRTFFDLAVASGSTDDPERFGEESAKNALAEGKITEEEREPFAAACADGAAAAKANGIDPEAAEAAEGLEEFTDLFDEVP